MSTMQERALQRRDSITFTKVDMHSSLHHSFHAHLDTKSAWELLAKISQEAWKEQTGKIAPTYVDKSVVRFITNA